MKNENGLINKAQAILILKFAELSEFEVFHYNTSLYKGSKLGCIDAIENAIGMTPLEDCFRIKQGSLTVCHPYEFEHNKIQVRYWFGNQPRIHTYKNEEEGNFMMKRFNVSCVINKVETNFYQLKQNEIMAKSKFHVEKEGHFRATMKSNHLGVADLEDMMDKGEPLIFTIDYVQNEYGVNVAGKITDALIAYFKEDIKPWVINAGNAKNIRRFVPNNSHLVQHWKNILIELYVDSSVVFGKEKTGGIRVKLQQPQPKDAPIVDKRKAFETDERFNNAIKSINDGDFTVEALQEKFILSDEQFKRLCGISRDSETQHQFYDLIEKINNNEISKEAALKMYVFTSEQLEKLGEI